jgi:hypothetical protein
MVVEKPEDPTEGESVAGDYSLGLLGVPFP